MSAGKQKETGKIAANAKLRVASAFNRFTGRVQSLLNLLDTERRDLNKECGYPATETLDIFTYKQLWEREAVPARVVSIYPDQCWKLTPEIYETEDPDPTKLTPFELSWNEVEKNFSMIAAMRRLDEISGLGRFGIMLLGIGDKKELSEPVDGIDDFGRLSGTSKSPQPNPLLYVNCYDESQVTIADSDWEKDTKSARFGKPKFYTIKLGMGPDKTEDKKVHWHRVIHVADNVKTNTLFGMPRMQQVYNRLLDIRKILGGSAEGCYRSGFPIIVAEADPTLTRAGAEFDEESLKDQFDAVMQGLQRQLLLQGATAKAIGGTLADTSTKLRDQLENLCIALGVPLQTFIGSEVGLRSAETNSTDWNDRLNGRRNGFLTPFLIVQVVDRLIAAKVTAAPGEAGYQVWWPDPNAPTPKEQAEIAKLQCETLAMFVRDMVYMVIAPELFMTLVMGWDDKEAQEAAESVKEMENDLLLPEPDEDEDGDDGSQQEGETVGEGEEDA